MTFREYYGTWQDRFPKTLFKYLGTEDYHFEMLEQEYLYFSKPSQFNDPFDCHSEAYLPDDLDLVKKYYSDHGGPKYSDELIKIVHADSNKRLRSIAEGPNFADSFLKVLSLTAQKNRLSMWGHYSNNHKGFVVELSVQKADDYYGIAFKGGKFSSRLSLSFPKGFQMLIPVKYSEQKPGPFDITSKTKEIVESVYVKSSEWETEEEFRIVLVPDEVKDFNEQHFPLKTHVLRSVFMGWKISDFHKDLVKEIIKKKKSTGRSIKLYQSRPVPGKFALTFDEVQVD